ncbi:hypothetical protein CB0940_01963 [Cercospora beticola]|uniref:Uncharacterized protein n=1 Tax=Cercospora beticola TaxID=122368 RepID=A0A2G5I8W2_CERBT|nr:hypothetical protein CB0940_01963 [Cercospora beticola]PIB00944.1 hypothetical protein CB0940_01963 [Cercospora beticola]WPA97428.1 hypothetical protein RHO25_002038 [Cercospora beticola]CAK1354136.1 unnamed protein product [Cercospora beticola]
MHILDHIKSWPFLRRLLSKVPGPFLAKFTRLWKVWHLLRGTYRAKLQQLHALHGPLIQVAPREFSWQFFNTKEDTKSLRVLEKQPSPVSSIVENTAARSLRNCLQMERLNHNEQLIDACNALFRCVLQDAAQKQAPVDLANLLTRYAFDVMFSVTTGERAGFIDKIPNANKIYSKLESWKFYSVLYGSYLRYHPFLKALLPIIRCRSQGQDAFDPVLEVLGQSIPAEPACTQAREDGLAGSDEHKLACVGGLEARTALAIAGADSATSLSLAVLKHVGADEELQHLLLAEMTVAGLTSHASFQDLARHKLHMPRTNALIQHHMRILGLHDIGLSYVSPEGGFKHDENIIEAGHTVHVTSNDSGFAEVDIGSFQALDSALVPEIQRHLPAYNLWTQDHSLADCHYLLVSKLLAVTLQNFSITSVSKGVQVTVADRGNEESDNILSSDGKSDSEVDKISDVTSYEGNSSSGASDLQCKITISPSNMDILGENFGPAVTDELFRLFDPNSKSAYGYDVLRVGPVKHSVARFMVHKAIREIYGDRLKHPTDMDDIINIAGEKTRMKVNKHGRKKIRYPVIRPWYKDGIEGRRPRPVNQKWGGWATQEHQKSMDAQSEESYLRQQQANLVADASCAKAEPPKPTIFKETYKQTGASNGTGPRKVLRVETTIHDGNGSITTSSDGVLLDQEVKAKVEPAPTTRPEGWVPPHMRARLERERHAAEAAAAAELASHTPLPASPELGSATPTSSNDSPRSSSSIDRTDSPLDPLAPEFTFDRHSK